MGMWLPWFLFPDKRNQLLYSTLLRQGLLLCHWLLLLCQTPPEEQAGPTSGARGSTRGTSSARGSCGSGTSGGSKLQMNWFVSFAWMR